MQVSIRTVKNLYVAIVAEDSRFLAQHIGYPIPWFFVRQASTIMGMAKPSPQFAGDPVLVALGVAIRKERSDRDLSQEALAVDADLDRSYMGGIERGEHNLTVMNLVKIARAMNLTPSKLFISADL